MLKKEQDITILAIGDLADFDSFRKLDKEKHNFSLYGFDYVSCHYSRLLEMKLPKIKTEKIIIFLFFPFDYWNKFIEYKNYRGIYGNRTFFKKFVHFWKDVEHAIKKSLPRKSVLYINHPYLCGLYRDKVAVKSRLSHVKIPNPKGHTSRGIVYIEKLVNNGNNLFLKPRYGSMGKGITFLSMYNWQTNFIFKNNKIHSRRSDRGWKFRDITGKNIFLRKLLKKDIIIEDAINPLVLRRRMIDLRTYVFFGKVIYIYPRKNKPDKITTNISQGARGDPELLKRLPPALLRKARDKAIRVCKALNLNFVGMDIMPDRDHKHIYIIDVNLFAGFPKRKTFNLSQSLIKHLARLNKQGTLHFQNHV
ncbi:MAG: hypothetical protein KJ593_03035 [Candidatus Omnitrophica bacterium]|nr:hypothetical protein [Candidatus Omnitrophota bacterium]